MGVAPGEISASSTDAVNGSQLYTTNQNVQAALTGLEQMANQLLQTGVCGLTVGSVGCSSNLQLAGGTLGAGVNHTIAIGGGSNAQFSGGIAVGHNAHVAAANSIAIGAEAQAVHQNSVAIGSGSTTSAANTVSVGSTGNERRITHVAPGVLGTDAVNVDQLHAMIAGMGGATLQYVDERIEALRVETDRGIAAAAAMVKVQPSAVGKIAVGVGIGHYSGQTAIGFSYAQAPQEGVLLSFSAATPVGSSPVLQGTLSMEF